MSKKPIIGGIILAAVIGVVFVGAQINPDNPENLKIDDSDVFHVRLADSSLYENGVYSEMFQIEKGVYKFRFVPNGDSPKRLSIMLLGFSTSFDEDFELKGTLIEDGISSYYTWEYLGQKRINVDNSQEVKILIDPNGNYDGPVSVDLNKLN